MNRTNSEQWVLPACPEHGITVEEAADYERHPNCYACDDGAVDEVERLRAGIWKMVGILGFDQDGAEHHHLTHPDIVGYGIEKVTEMRKDYDEACDEADTSYKGSGMADV